MELGWKSILSPLRQAKIVVFNLSLFLGFLWAEHKPFFAEKDRIVLEPFFKMLLSEETLGYVLLEEKSIAFLSYIPNLSWAHPFRSLFCLRTYLSPKNQILKKGWNAWTKYENGVSDEFLFAKETSIHNPLSVWVFVIHKNLFCKTINENKFDFERILDRKITGEELFEEAKRKPLFSKVLKRNEGLLGILLGFGKNNSWLFSNGKMDQLGYFPMQEDISSPVDLPAFRANWNDPETLLLRDKYIRSRKKIEEVFFGNEPLDQVFRFLFPSKAPLACMESQISE